MSEGDWDGLVASIGLPAAVFVAVVFFLARNGFLQVRIHGDHDDGVDELTQVKKATADLNVRVSILEDRSDRESK